MNNRYCLGHINSNVPYKGEACVDYVMIGLRTLLMYLIILVIFRLMGKREIGELSLLDLVVSIMIGEIAIMAIEDRSRPLWEAILPMLILMLIQILLSILSLKSRRFRDAVDGKPTIIIDKGKIDAHAMKKQRYNYDDLLTQLREQNIFNVQDVYYAILETSGTLSIIEKQDMNKEMDMAPFPFILDGTVQHESLKRAGKTEEWLKGQLQKHGKSDISNITVCTYQNGDIFIEAGTDAENT